MSVSIAILLLTAATLVACGQSSQQPRTDRSVDVGVSYIAMRSLKAASTQNFWMQGGSAEAGTGLWRDVDVAVNLTGTHAGSIGSSSVPLSLFTVTAGPRYRWRSKRRWSPYGEALFGVAHGFDSVFPSQTATSASTEATSFATQLGGGLDYQVTQHVSARVLDIAYTRTMLPNGTNDLQNSLRLGAGVTLRFGLSRKNGRP